MSSHAAGVRTVTVKAEPIELCQLLKFSGLAATGGEAKSVIGAGQVRLNDALETQKRKKVMAGDRVTYAGETIIVALG